MISQPFSLASSRRVVVALLAVCVWVSPGALRAQNLSASDILDTLSQQAPVWKESIGTGLGPPRSLGGERGLKIYLPEAGPENQAESAAGTVPEEIAGVEVSQGPYGQFDDDLTIALEINFAFDSAALEPSETPKLQEMCEALNASEFIVRVIGHTDSSGSASYNQQLSVLRAGEVARHFVETCGIEPTRLEIMGVGENVPANASDPAADENRRVEFQAVG